MNRLYILTGKTASGKSTAESHLVNKYGVKSLVLTTTRPKRPHEVDGVDYEFVTDKEFNTLASKGRFIYSTIFNAFEKDGGELQSWQYGLIKQPLQKDSVVVTDIDHVKVIKDYYEGLGVEVIVIYFMATIETREQRARDRQGDDFSLDEWIRRTMDETMCYTIDKITDLCDYIVDNELEGSIEKFFKDVIFYESIS